MNRIYAWQPGIRFEGFKSLDDCAFLFKQMDDFNGRTFAKVINIRFVSQPKRCDFFTFQAAESLFNQCQHKLRLCVVYLPGSLDQ